jgi:hypothetical protein
MILYASSKICVILKEEGVGQKTDIVQEDAKGRDVKCGEMGLAQRGSHELASCLPKSQASKRQNKATIHPATIFPPSHSVRRICRIHLQPSATTCLHNLPHHRRRNGNRDDTTTSRKTSTSSSPARKVVALVWSSRIKVFAMSMVLSPSAVSSRRLSLHHSSHHPNAPLYDHLSAHHSAPQQMVTTLR